MALFKNLFATEETTTTKHDEIGQETSKFIETILRKMDEFCEIESSYEPETNSYLFNIIGGDAGRIIGHKGETLENLRFLTKVFINRRLKEEKPPNIILDIAGYVEKRKTAIEFQVKEAIRRMERMSKFSILLDYMSAYDRKIAHEIAAEMGYTSESIGQGRSRRVKLKGKNAPSWE